MFIKINKMYSRQVNKNCGFIKCIVKTNFEKNEF